MIIFLYGQDSYRTRQKLNEIIESYKKIHKSGLNFKNLDFQDPENSVNDLKNQIRQASMFKEKKMVIITNAFSNKRIEEKISEEVKNLEKSEDIILFYEGGKVDERSILFESLKKNCKCQKFDLLSGLKLKNWLKKEFEKYQQAKIDPRALELLVDYIGNDLWRITNEIKKLVSYRKKGIIEEKDVKLLVRPKIETDVFKTIDAISQKNKKLALEFLHKHLEKGDSPLYLLSMINFQFRNLLIVKSRCQSTNDMRMIRINNLSKDLKMHPYVIKKSLWQINKFTLEELKKIYQKIFQVDLNIKTGKIEPETALDLLIAEI